MADLERMAENSDIVCGYLFAIALNSYWDIVTGFDVIAFDEFIQPEDGTSTRDAIMEKYGEKAVKLIETLIHAPAPVQPEPTEPETP